jgi:hypothetical protein
MQLPDKLFVLFLALLIGSCFAMISIYIFALAGEPNSYRIMHILGAL